MMSPVMPPTPYQVQLGPINDQYASATINLIVQFGWFLRTLPLCPARPVHALPMPSLRDSSLPASCVPSCTHLWKAVSQLPPSVTLLC